MTKKSVLRILLYSFLLLLLIACLTAPILVYMDNFKGYGKSHDPSHWGVLGDYIGGILNPFISLLNLFLLIYITRYVESEDQRKRFNQLRYDAYLEYSKLLNEFNPPKATVEETAELWRTLDGIQFTHLFLFEGKDNETYQVLLATLKGILLRMQTYKNTYEPMRAREQEISDRIPGIKEALNIMNEGEIPGAYEFKSYERYPLQRQIFLGFMQRVIVDGDRKPYENWDIDKFMKDREKRATPN